MPRQNRSRRDALSDLGKSAGVGLLFERDDLSGCIEPEQTHAGRVAGPDRLCSDRDVGAAIDVRIDQFTVVHAVQVVAGENQVVVGVVADEMAYRLAYGV